MKWTVFVSLIMLLLSTLACSLGASGGGGNMSVEELQAEFDKLPAGDAARGEQIFVAQPCKTCHIDLGVGPAFPGSPALAALAATRKSGYSAQLYLYESIVAPNAYIVPGFQKDIMPAEYHETLSRQELADLVTYLMSLK
jgi:mono/diheme cytochrome c family protein